MKPSGIKTLLLIVLSFLILMLIGALVTASKFGSIFEELLSGAELPTLTKYIIGVTRWLESYWWLVFAGGLLVLVGWKLVFGFEKIVFRRTPTLVAIGVLFLLFGILVFGLFLPMMEIIKQMNA